MLTYVDFSVSERAMATRQHVAAAHAVGRAAGLPWQWLSRFWPRGVDAPHCWRNVTLRDRCVVQCWRDVTLRDRRGVEATPRRRAVRQRSETCSDTTWRRLHQPSTTLLVSCACSATSYRWVRERWRDWSCMRVGVIMTMHAWWPWSWSWPL